MATRLADIVLDKKNFRIDLPSWRDKDIIDFAPRATTPGSSTILSDLGLYQPLLQTDWQHGFGHHWYDDASGYLSTSGSLDTRHDGLVMMFTAPVSSDTTNSRKDGFVVFNGFLYSWGAFGLRKFTPPSTWASVYSTAAVNYALSDGTYLLFCPDGLRIQKMDTSGVITDAGLDVDAKDYKWLAVHYGQIYAGVDGTNRIHYDTNPDLSQLEGTIADPSVIYCGIGNIPTIGAIEYAANLYAARQDGLWLVGDDLICRRVIDYSGEVSSENFRSMVVFNGYLIYPIRDRVIQWNGARVSDITPEKVTDTFPYVTYGRFANFVVTGGFMYCTARTNESTYDEVLLCFDGSAWHKLADLIVDSTSATVSSMGYDVVNNYLWYHIDTTSDVTYYFPLQARSAFPYASFPTSGTHSLFTSRLDMGFRRVKKSMPSILMEVSNVNSTRYISVYYQLDGSGSWSLWGHIKTNGVVELRNPGGMKTREFNYANLRFDFTTDTSGQSPILEGYTVRFIMRPDVLWGYSFYVVAATEASNDYSEDERTSAQIKAQLLNIRNSKAPVELIDMFGDTHYGYLTSVQGSPAKRTEGTDGEPDDIEMRYLCNFACVDVEQFRQENTDLNPV